MTCRTDVGTWSKKKLCGLCQPKVADACTAATLRHVLVQTRDVTGYSVFVELADEQSLLKYVLENIGYNE